jgi:NarL family two-component system response regulator LiaR
MIKVLLIEDNDGVRNALRRALRDVRDIEVVGEACSGVEGLAMVDELRPEVVIVDGQMPDMDGPDTTTALLHECSSLRVIGYSGDPAMEQRLRRAGAVSFLLKPQGARELSDSIRSCVLRSE